MSDITLRGRTGRVSQAELPTLVRVALARKNPTTNLAPTNSRLISEAQRAEVNAWLATPLRGTNCTDSVARKALRVQLRAEGFTPADARELAAEIVRA
jgi:hypothetical protein